MWPRKSKVESMSKEYSLMRKTMGILMEELEQYHMFEHLTPGTYTSKASQTTEILSKYQGTAALGNQILQRLINLRVAFSVPNRLFLMKNPNTSVSDSQVKKIKTFLDSFMSLNGLDSSMPKDFCRESEFEGEVLVRLVWDRKEKLPRLKYYPYSKVGYEIKPKESFMVNSKLMFRLWDSEQRSKKEGSDVATDWSNTQEVYEDNDFVFIAFNDKLNVYVGYPTCGGILTTIENVDKDLVDWRKLNHLFAHPTPHFKCETEEDAEAINEMIKSVGWKVGTAIATSSTFDLKGPTGAEGTLLMLSIQTGAKIISGHTGIGIHFLGFANVMSNRATADSMGEPTEVVLHSEITSWQRFYIDLFAKAIRMRNKHLNAQLNEYAVLPKLTPLTDRQWRTVKDVYLPAKKEGLISLETFLDKLPDVDSAAEMEKIEAEEKKKEEKQKKNGGQNIKLRQGQGESVLPNQPQNQPGFSRAQGQQTDVG